MREAWTDERLDDLNQRVTEGFSDIRAELRTEVKSLRTDMNGRMGEVNGRINEMNGRINETNERINQLNRTLMQCFLGLGTLTLTGFIGLLVQSAGS